MFCLHILWYLFWSFSDGLHWEGHRAMLSSVRCQWQTSCHQAFKLFSLWRTQCMMIAVFFSSPCSGVLQFCHVASGAHTGPTLSHRAECRLWIDLCNYTTLNSATAQTRILASFCMRPAQRFFADSCHCPRHPQVPNPDPRSSWPVAKLDSLKCQIDST